jgi:hypothetical protein
VPRRDSTPGSVILRARFVRPKDLLFALEQQILHSAQDAPRNESDFRREAALSFNQKSKVVNQK